MESEPTDNIERKIAAVFLIVVVFMQVVSAFTRAIQTSDGRCGRFMYYIAFVLNLIHELFIGIVVPASLLWTARELLVGIRSLDALLAAVVGSLWYGPERVQHAIANLTSLRLRCTILIAALGNYHRAAIAEDYDGSTLTRPKKISRRLRYLPWWSPKERDARPYWNGRVKQSNYHVTELTDAQLRSIARQGEVMALSGDFDESKLRYWCAGMVADQARFPLSNLDNERDHDWWTEVLGGYEGTQLLHSFEEHNPAWSDSEKRKLASVANGIRKNGLEYVRKAKWLE